MKSSFRIKLAVALVGAIIAGFGGTYYARAEQDEKVVARISEKMQTICVGRFLIDLPEEAEVELSSRIDGFDISAFAETMGEFQKRVAEREAQLRAIPDRLGGSNNLESVRDVKSDSGLTGKIFMHSRTVVEGTRGNGLGIERYRDEGMSTEALVHAKGLSIDLSSENRSLEWMDDLPKLVNQLVANPHKHIPTQPGFCTDRAYFLEPLAADQREHVMMFARLPSHPDIHFMLILSAGLKPDPLGLLERSSASGDWLSFLQRISISKLRAAPREIAGLPGEELVRSFVEENDARVYSFWWEVNGTKDDVLVPHFVFKMDTGKGGYGPVGSSLSEGVALGLWDKILSSIRIRPVAQGKQHSIMAVPVAAK